MQILFQTKQKHQMFSTRATECTGKRVPFPLHKPESVTRSKMRDGSQDEKPSYLCLELEKRFQYLQLKLCLLGKGRETSSNCDT